MTQQSYPSTEPDSSHTSWTLVRSINPALVITPKDRRDSDSARGDLSKISTLARITASASILILQKRRIRIRRCTHRRPPNRRNNIRHLAILVLHSRQVPPWSTKIHRTLQAGNRSEDIGVVEDVPHGCVVGGFAVIGGDVAFADDGDGAGFEPGGGAAEDEVGGADHVALAVVLGAGEGVEGVLVALEYTAIVALLGAGGGDCYTLYNMLDVYDESKVRGLTGLPVPKVLTKLML